MTDQFFEEKNTGIAGAADKANAVTAEQTERSGTAPLFVMQAKMSDAYSDDSLSHLLSKYSEDDLKRQSDRLSVLYDEPEEPDYTPIDFGDEEETEHVSDAPAGETSSAEPETPEAQAAEPEKEPEEPAGEPEAQAAEPEEEPEEPAGEPEAQAGKPEKEPEEPAGNAPEEETPIEEPKIEETPVKETEVPETETGEPAVTEIPAAEAAAEEPDFILSEGGPQRWYRMVPIILAAAVVPLIVQLKIYTRPLGSFFWTDLTDDSPIYDYYSWYKMIAVLGIAALCIIVFAIDVIRKKQRLKKSFVYIPAAVFVITVFASFAANGFREFTLFGWPGRMEGTLTLFAYMIILCYTVVTIDTARSARAACGAFCISLAVFTVIGMLQFAGYDPISTETGLRIAGTFEGVSEAMPGLIPEQTAVYQTFGDPSSSAMFLCLGIPVAAMLYTQSDFRGKWLRWFKAPLILILIWLCFINAAGLKSAVVPAGLAAALIAGLIIFHRNLKYWTKPLLLMLASLALVLTVTYRTWMPELQKLLPSVFPASESEAAEEARPGLASVTTGDDSVTFVLKGSNMVLILKTEAAGGSIVKVTPADGVGRTLTLSESGDPGVYLINEEPYHSVFKLCIIKRNNALALRVSMPQKDWDFVSEDGKIRFVSDTGRTVSLYEPERSGLISDPYFADCTGAVWNSALPMLKGTALIGRGADSFCLYYPHMDHAAAYTAGLDTVPSAEGPRSALINTAFGTGWISAAALAAIYLVYIVQSVIIFWRRKLSHPLGYTGAGIFLGTVGFLAAALVSDTSVCTMPSFLTLLGTGIAINRILRGGK
ncbi:MAG: hypothetical protein II185_04700 [Firmicutes bacterium]|nr:hypothetical protein [Bacillota bacterium]